MGKANRTKKKIIIGDFCYLVHHENPFIVDIHLKITAHFHLYIIKKCENPLQCQLLCSYFKKGCVMKTMELFRSDSKQQERNEKTERVGKINCRNWCLLNLLLLGQRA